MIDAQHDRAVHLDEAAIGIPGEPLIAARFGASPSTVASFRPRLSTVSIIPGIDTRAPERTDTSNGLSASPNFWPTAASTFASAASTCAVRSSGYRLSLS